MSEKGIIFSAPMVRALLAGRKTQTRRLLSLRGHRGFSDFGPSDTPGYDWHFRRADGCWCDITDERLRELLPYAPGDRLYVREACRAEELSRPAQKRLATRKERQRLARTTVIQCDELDGADGVRFLADDQWRAIQNTFESSLRWSELFYYRGRGKDRIGNTVPSIHMPRWASRLWLEVTDVRVQRVQEISEQDARAEGVLATGWEGNDIPAHCRIAFSDLWNSLHTQPGETWGDNPWIVALTFTVHHGNIDARGDE